MDITKINNEYINKTWKYLLPCLKGHGQDFVSKYNQLYKLACGIHDSCINNYRLLEDKLIYILINKSYATNKFNDFMDFLSDKHYFKGAYCPDYDLLKSNKMMVIIQVPERFFDTYDSFLEGNYSKMYTRQEIEILFNNEKKIKQYHILTKDKKSFNDFIDSVSKEFHISPSELSGINPKEWELPLKRKEEIFNCKEEGRIYYNKLLDKELKT